MKISYTVQFSGQSRYLKISFFFLISMIRARRQIRIGGKEGKSNLKKKTTRIKLRLVVERDFNTAGQVLPR